MRKLATIRRIREIRPIEGADRIEISVIDGWQCVTKKGEFKGGDLCVYFEIDSLLPERDEFEFLRKSCWVSDKASVNGAGFRLRTIRLRGELSQGLALPLSTFGDLLKDAKEGDDVTDILGVKKFERPIPVELDGEVFGYFPSYIPKTDQERIQNFNFTEDDFKAFWEVSVKLDGASMTVFKKDGELNVCTRNLHLKPSESNLLWRIARAYDLEDKIPEGFALHGELVGPGIQRNRWKLNKHIFAIFDIYLIHEGRYMGAIERQKFVFANGLHHVPIISNTDMIPEDWSYEYFLAMADEIPYFMESSANSMVDPWKEMKDRFGKLPYEGLVFKNILDSRRSFKVISNNYLLKTGE